MRLYSRTGATAVDDSGVHYEPGDDGGFDFPDHLGAHLHSFHAHGKPMWENQIERQRRLILEEADRRKDPATLLAAVEQLVQAAAGIKAAPEPETAPPAKPRKAAAAAESSTAAA